MSTINTIREILGSKAPAQLDQAAEHLDGSVSIPLHHRQSGLNKTYEQRNLVRALQPLVDRNYEVRPGPVNVRAGGHVALVVVPPVTVTGIDTWTLPLETRVRVEGRVRRKKGAPDVMDVLEVNEHANTVRYNTQELSVYLAREVEQVVQELISAGWQGTTGRYSYQSGAYGTLFAPGSGQIVSQARIDAFA